MSFIILTKEQFENILGDFVIVNDSRSQEYIYDLKTVNPKINVRIYSTVDKRTNQTRDIGTDAIRIVFWDIINNRPIGKGKKILRVESATTIDERIKKRISEFMIKAKDQEIIDFEYVKAILSHEKIGWTDFAKSMLDQINDKGSLSDKQLAYVIGKCNPKGFPTFESKLKSENPDFFEKYLENIMENENGEQQTNKSELAEPEKDNLKKETEETEGRVEDLLVRTEKEKGGIAPESDESIERRLIPTSEYSDWNYPFENFNPVQSEVFDYINEDKNMIIGANTSAGKTICAEFLIDSTLKKNMKVIYLSPLKSLTQEKYSDWQKRFPKEAITIMTGDYVLSDSKKEEIKDSRVIVMTSEMMDSRTRRMESERNYWLKEAGLVIVDESHILSTSRGHAVETGIMRFTRINKDARVLFLSATMPNVKELGDWLTLLNGKQTTIIYNTWRPVELQMHYEEYQIVRGRNGREEYWETQDNKRTLAVNLALSKPEEKFLIFCHDKATGRDIVRRLEQKGEQAYFHNADLDLNERLGIEQSFQNRENGLRVMVSTSTLAWGRNLPARNVIIVGVHRGINKVDELDIIQMAGRAGRYGIDDEGHVYMVIPQGTTQTWDYTFHNPRPVKSVLNNHQTLAFHILAEIESKEIQTVKDVFKWYSRSLVALQGLSSFNETDAESLIQDLLKMEMVGFSRMNLFITGLGRVSAWLYFSPYDVYAWYKNFNKLFAESNDKAIQDDLVLSWAVGDVPKNDLGYIPRDIQNVCENTQWLLRNRGIQSSTSIPTIQTIYMQITGEEVTGLFNTMKRGIIFDIDREIQAIALIDKMYAKWDKQNVWQTLPVRIKYGIPEKLVELTKLSGIGGKKAKKLYDKGIKTLTDVADKSNKKILAAIFVPTMVNQIQKQAQELLAVNQ